MKTTLPKKAKDIKGAVAIAELKRAHCIIAILATAFAAMLACVATYPIQLDPLLSLIVIVMLACVAIVSVLTALMLQKRA